MNDYLEFNERTYKIEGFWRSKIPIICIGTSNEHVKMILSELVDALDKTEDNPIMLYDKDIEWLRDNNLISDFLTVGNLKYFSTMKDVFNGRE